MANLVRKLQLAVSDIVWDRNAIRQAGLPDLNKDAEALIDEILTHVRECLPSVGSRSGE